MIPFVIRNEVCDVFVNEIKIYKNQNGGPKEAETKWQKILSLVFPFGKTQLSLFSKLPITNSQH